MNPIGVYWSVMHRRPQDYEYFKRLQPSVFKIMDGGESDYRWARENLPNSLIIARDWALSEQHSDMLKDPVGTGKRHAREWNEHQERLGFDKANTLILGINEPRVWEAGMAEALRQYTIAMCDEATTLGLRVGAMQLSVGWPSNDKEGVPPNWQPYHGVDNAIRRNNGVLVLHEYWADQGPSENWGWWAGRALKCPWQVPIVIGECGIDMYVKDGSVPHNARGWRGRKSPEQYASELKEYADRMAQDKRFIGGTPFASDYANKEWFSFDVEPAYQAILALPPKPIAQHTVRIPLALKGEQPTPQPTQPSTGKVPPLAHPVQDPTKREVTQVFGVNPDAYARFGLAGHNGVDFATPMGTQIVAVDDGEVMESLIDPAGYGEYVKLRHPWGESIYAHLSKRSLLAGGVRKGGVIGLSGNTGNSTGPHLHFGLRVNPYKRGWPYDGYVDPMPYLQAQATPVTPVTPAQPTGDVLAIIKAAAQEFGLDWRLLLSQAMAESSLNPNAVSKDGAQGLMQVMPKTWAEQSPLVNGGNDPFDARQNARVGAAYLKRMLSPQVANGNVYKALIAYGWGPGNLLSGKDVPAQWQEYANKIVFGRDLLKAVGG